MKGVLFKYQANPDSPDLRDCKDDDICGIADPDFWTNKHPDTYVWAVCGPYVRMGLEKGDVLFFLPQLSSIRKAGLGHTDYICTGVLVAADFTDSSKIKTDSRFTSRYRGEYAADLKAHLRNKKEAKRTKDIRGDNIVIGNPPRSKWLGRKGAIVKDVLPEGTLRAWDLKKMRIPYINDSAKVKVLYRSVMGRGYA